MGFYYNSFAVPADYLEDHTSRVEDLQFEPYDVRFDWFLTKFSWKIAELENRINALESKQERNILVSDLRSNKLELNQPLPVFLQFNVEHKKYIAEQWDLNLWGEGEDEQTAIDDLLREVESFYFELEEDQPNLGIDMRRRWFFLKGIVLKKHATKK